MTKSRSKSNKKLSQVRIIGGEYRRRLVSFVDAEGLRPTPDRVRETIFNWLNEDIVNSTVLDCCAGSGVLGFESLSRGARHVTMIEPNFDQFLQLQQTQSHLKIDNSKLTFYNDTAEAVIQHLAKTTTQAFDVIFLDPPYRLNLWQNLIELLIEHKLTHYKTVFYIEADKEHDLILTAQKNRLEQIKYKKIGQIYAGIYQLD